MYLENMMMTYNKQQVLERLYELYNNTTDELEREDINKIIDDVVVYDEIPEDLVKSKYYRHIVPIKERFGHEMRSKAIYKTLKRIVETKQYTDVEVAKAMSSLITHALIEYDMTSDSLDDIYEELDLGLAMGILNEFFENRDIPQDSIIEVITNLFPELLHEGKGGD